MKIYLASSAPGHEGYGRPPLPLKRRLFSFYHISTDSFGILQIFNNLINYKNGNK